ncbi:MAG TPA: cytochrome P450 [Streptosporangiaceae bacterium]
MTSARQPAGQGGPVRQAAGLARSGPGGEWVACRYADVQAVLCDDRFGVDPAAPGGPAGTISWLRASVSRFANGGEHRRRRALVLGELARLDPSALAVGVRQRAGAVLGAVGQPGDRADVMALLARRVPMATMAAALGAPDPGGAAAAAIDAAAAYFGGAGERARQAADAGTAALAWLLGPGKEDLVAARISLLVQACDAVAGLIGESLAILQDAPDGAGWPTEAVLTEVLRYRPAVRLSRRVALDPVRLGGGRGQPADVIICDLDAANSDPAVFEGPGRFDPARPGPASLTFGYGLRPCPAPAHALALAGGVVDAVRTGCEFLPGQRISYEPQAALRIPRRLEVILR